MAATTQISFDFGFTTPMRAQTIETVRSWHIKLDEALTKGEIQCKPLKSNQKGPVAEVTIIEQDSPGALHDLYRYAVKVKGTKATFDELAVVMNEKSTTYFAQSTSSRTEIHLSAFQVYRWFKNNGGKELSPIEKPLDTPELIKQRLKWIQKWEEILLDPKQIKVFIDEK